MKGTVASRILNTSISGRNSPILEFWDREIAIPKFSNPKISKS
jgi:hypothetical protein